MLLLSKNVFSAAAKGLSQTLMGRIRKEFPIRLDEIMRLLPVQYRMNELIMNWASEAMYEGKLDAASSVKSHTLRYTPFRVS